MIVYHYNPYSLQYTGCSQAYEDPLVPNRWVQPAFATFIEPPQDGKTYLFINNEWVEREEEVLDAIERELPIDYWEILRGRRNELLRESDYLFYTDSPLREEERQIWVVYRQSLRDLPANTLDASQVIYPNVIFPIL